MAHPLLVDAERMHRENPDTFGILSLEERSSLGLGDYAKVCLEDENSGERFWVEVKSVDTNGYPPQYAGRVANEIHGWDVCRDGTIEFEARHVYALQRADGVKVTFPSPEGETTHLLRDDKALCGEEGGGVLEDDLKSVTCVECVIESSLPSCCAMCGESMEGDVREQAKAAIRKSYSVEQIFAFSRTKGGFTLRCTVDCAG